MKIRSVMFGGALIAATTLFLSHSTADDKPGQAKDAKAAPGEDEATKKWMEAATPGPAHKALDALAGEWEIDSKWWMAPDAPPATSKGTSKVTWTLDGRFLQDEFKGEMMGMPFLGMGLTGYDNMKKKYVGVWIDNMGTGMFNSTGTLSKDGKTFNFEGKMDDPMTGEMNKTMKFTIKIVSADKHIFEMHDPSLGEKSMCGEMTYTRKK